MKLFFVICFLFLLNDLFAQQDAPYNLYMFDHSIINPSFAGSKDYLNVSLISHQQWVGISGSPKLNFLTIQAPLKKKHIGLGLQVLSETMGPEALTGLMGCFAYRIPWYKGILSLALRGGISYYTINWSEINFKDNLPSSTGYPGSKLSGTADFGVNYSSSSFYLGLSGTHLNPSPTVPNTVLGSSPLAPHFFLETGKAYEVNPNFTLNPSILVKYVQNAPPVADLNLNAFIDNLVWVGVSYKTSMGAAALFQVNATPLLHIGYAYQYDFSSLGLVSKGSHEIHLSYDFNGKERNAPDPRKFF
jgi:type IX secretion system PorP/SprF family membrane protein